MAIFVLCAILMLTESSRGLVENSINVVTSVRTKSNRYTTDCGTWGWKTCTRYRLGYYRHHECRQGYRSTDNVGCPWAICDGAINPTGACNIDYKKSHIIYSNGQVQHSSGGTCLTPEQCTQCKEGFYASPNRCRMCSAIQHCDLETCTSSSNQVCSRCEGVILEQQGHRAYAVSPDRKACIKACSWREDSTICYPGTCDVEHASSCSCMDEFSGSHCQTIDTTPPIMYNILKLFGPGLEKIEVPDNPNEGSPQNDSWTNINDTRRIEYKFTSQFIPKAKLPDSHAYIEDYAVGIVDGFVTFNVIRNESEIRNDRRPCGGATKLSPNQGVFTCQADIPAGDILDLPVQSGDIMEFSFVATNGGFVKIRNKEKNILKTVYYSGKTRTNLFRLGIDFINPHHCSVEENSDCLDNMLSVANSSTTTPIPLEWEGWVDDVAVHNYKISVFDLIDKNLTDDNSKLHEKSQVLIKDVHSPQKMTDLSLTQPGAYAIVLTAYDKAGNHKSTRRIVIFDGTSEVESLSHADLLVTSAAQEADYLWQWEVDSVSVDWQNRYINHLHHNNRWLKAVADTEDVEREYDDNGFSRGIEAIPNVQAIVEYRTAYQIDHSGGSTMTTSPPDPDFRTQNLTQNQTVTPHLEDGDTLRFWIRAYDIRREYLEENVTVHIDTTPPVIENLWLTREDRVNLSVHSIEDFNKMTFEWVSYDIHSGLETVSWRLFDNFTREDILHGMDRLSAQGDTLTLEECKQRYGHYARGANCYCTPGMGCYHRHYQVTPRVITNQTHGGVFHDLYKGVHDSDYFLEVTVMNHAKLYSKLDIQITLDASPPHTGAVHDGLSGKPEVDYQDELEIHAHWDGFFDRESGVKFYQFAFSDHCLTDDDFGLDLESYNITETYATHANWTAPGTGTYYITVIAYNRALEPSSPVCSDGVTIDVTPPEVSCIAVLSSRVPPGLVTSSSGEVWFIDNERRRSQIAEASDLCRSKGTAIEDSMLDMFPLHVFPNGTDVRHQAAFCNTVDMFPQSFLTSFYVSREHQLYVNWTGSDNESGIYDYQLGLMSDSSGEAAPDILPYTSTHHHPQYLGYHPLLSEGEHFYIGVKAINKAGLSTTKTVGPVTIHTSKPEFTGQMIVTLSENQDYLLADWTSGVFTDVEENYLSYKVSVGTAPHASDVLSYHPIQSGPACTLSSPITCTVIAIQDLHWDLHHSHTYFVSVMATNMVGLSTVGVSQPYVHDVRLPSWGVVLDVCPEHEQFMFDVTDFDESDHQTSTDSLKVRWYGFDDDGILNVTYKAGIGSEAGRVNVRDFEDVGSTRSHEFKGLALNTSQTYFVTVVATSAGGQVAVSSDGVTIILNNVIIDNVVVYDGLGCTVKDLHSWSPGHYNTTPPDDCAEDLQYQKSTSVISAHWNITEDYRRLYPDLQWSLQRKMPRSDGIWHTNLDYIHLRPGNHLLSTGLQLKSGYTYRVSIKLCAVKVCSKSIHSDGVTILHRPPVAGTMNVTYRETETRSEIGVRITRFYDPDVPVKSEAYNMIERYEWCLTDNTHDRNTLTNWIPVDQDSQITKDELVNIIIHLPQQLTFSKCRRLAIKGYNKLGLFTIVSTSIKNCTTYNPALVIPSVVIDTVGQEKAEGIGSAVSLEQNDHWSLADSDYTPFKNILSAVWPTLRHRDYRWAVVSGGNTDPKTHYKRGNIMTISNPCIIPGVIKCGTTDKEFVNIIMDPPLQHGSRYYICIHADPRTVEYEKWTEELAEVNACSDGVTVDLTPPEGGRVFIGGLVGNRYQVSHTEMEIHWDSFMDVEEEGHSPYPSGVSHYQVALGTVPGGSDIMKMTDVGLVNHVTMHGLNLHDGHTIYASVKATDLVNKSSEVSSEGVTIDSSPPQTTGKQITVLERYITHPVFDACWDGVLVDKESGMKRYEVSLGSRPFYDDLIAFSSLEEQCIGFDITEFVQDGHVRFISLKGYNNAGLVTLITSRPLVVDTTAPSVGEVYDGLRALLQEDEVKDRDFVTRLSDMGAYWEGFSDPHSSISHFLINMGTCPGCEDILGKQNIGARTDAVFDGVPFVPGVKYYVEVTACNMAGLCSKGTSDGVIIDLSPPVAGYVMDGTEDVDTQFLSSRTLLGCKWRSFYDPESGLDHYEWRVGTTPGGNDILTARSEALKEIAFLTLSSDQQLPVGQKLFIAVKAYNKAGMFTESSSNGITVDDTPPEVVQTPEHVNDLGSVSTAFSRSALKIKWEFRDNETSIERQYLSLASDQLGEFDSSLLQVPGLLREYVFSQLDLHDGSLYTVKITACNMGGLCTTSFSADILMDSSPPKTGMFAVHTDHSARLSRHQTGWMVWTETSLRLAWLGFSDLHSGVQHYFVTVGSEEFASDLNKDQQPVVLSHSSSGTDQGDEGVVQTFVVETQDLSSRTSVFVAIWAVNGVGLKSAALHSELELNSGGELDLVRRCHPYSCEGHCVCAVQDGSCPAGETCSQFDNNIVTVTDVTGVTIATDGDEDYSCFDTYMAAKWSSRMELVKYYEVSVGDSDTDYPEGVFDSSTDRIWFDVGQITSAIIALPRGKELSQGHNYSFFVRAWYNDTSFSISKSDGLMIDTSNPQTTKIHGLAVKEVNAARGEKDIDYQTQTDRVYISWKDVFPRGHSGILKYRVYISTKPGGHSIHESGDLTTYSYAATGLSLEPNTVYYSSVLVFNKAGLVSWDYSDGVQVDSVPPLSGMVHDGTGMHDVDYQSSSTMVSASWYGFSDSDSSVVKYYWCVGTVSDTRDCSILDWQDTGLQTSATRPADVIASGTTVWNKVYAVDAVGHTSAVAISDGVTIDTSPPVSQDLAYLGENIIANPSFEAMEGIVNKTQCVSLQPEDWVVDDDSCADVITTTRSISRDGESHIHLSGCVSQTVAGLMLKQNYRVSLHTGYAVTVEDDHKTVEGVVSVGDERFTFSQDPHTCRGICNVDNQDVILWSTHTYSFIATSTTTVVKVCTTSRTMMMAVDHISVRSVSYTDQDRSEETEAHMVFNTVFLPHWSSIHVSWHFKDDQSPITNYKWAVGLLKGGSQLQEFQSIGRRTQGTLSGQRLVHNSKVYVTVMATNGAGLTTVSYSDPLVVDLTPPIIEYIHDGLVGDTDFIAADKMSANWKVIEEESQIAYCDLAIGRFRGLHDIKGFERIPSGQSFAKYNLSETVTSSTTVFTTLRCFNTAGYVSAATSDGAEVVVKGEKTFISGLEVMEERSSLFWEGGQCHSDSKSLRLKWDGSHTNNVQSTTVRLDGEDMMYVEEVPVVFPYSFCMLTGFHMKNFTEYNVSLSSLDHLGQYGEDSIVTIWTQGRQPVVKENIGIRTTHLSEGKITLSWSGLFTSPWPHLDYEVEVGRFLGGADVLDGHITRDDSIELSHVHTAIKELYITVTAIDPCGHAGHYTQRVDIVE